MLSFLDKEHAIARPGFNRWLVPPAALAIHLSIGQVYAFSVFKKPLIVALGVKHGLKMAVEGDWSQTEVAVIFSIAIAVLGLSSALFGWWLEKVGPRKVMFTAACCFGLGFEIAALGVHLHEIWLLYLGYGVIGGIGLGLGYISPVATLVRWFPDRPGMATGLAIMGFGGGALIGSPLALYLMAHFKNAHSVGATKAMIVMGALYFAFMMFGVFTIRTPAPGWKPEGWTPKPKPTGMITTRNVAWRSAFKAPQFYLLWLVLCLNTTAGIGILEQASLLIQNIFGRSEAAGAGFVGILSLFNMGGRFFWSTTSDYIGRKTTYAVFFVVGTALFVILPWTGAAHWDSIVLFVLICGVLLSMYGGGFSTMPAFVRDLFGPRDLSQIYGPLLTAWSVAGILGPMLVNNIRDYQVHHGVPLNGAYATVMYVMASLLFVGLICDLLIRRVNERHYATEVMPAVAQAFPATQPSASHSQET